MGDETAKSFGEAEAAEAEAIKAYYAPMAATKKGVASLDAQIPK